MKNRKFSDEVNEFLAKNDILTAKDNAEKQNIVPNAELSAAIVDDHKDIQREDADGKTHSGHRARMRSRVKNDMEFTNFEPHEMLEFLLYHGIKRVDTNPIAHKLIEHFGSFERVFYASVEELKNAVPISDQAAHTIASVLPIARWVEIKSRSKGKPLSSFRAMCDEFEPYFKYRERESVYAVGLNNFDRVIRVWKAGEGLANYADINITKLIITALNISASKIILMHNHPGDSRYPSKHDCDVTARVSLALTALGIQLVDHIIFVPSGNHFSFSNDGSLMDLLEAADNFCNTDIVREVYGKGLDIADRKTLKSIGTMGKAIDVYKNIRDKYNITEPVDTD